MTSWTGDELTDEAQRRQLVDAISTSHVNRGVVLRKVNLKPHRSRYWCNTTEKDLEKFQRDIETVCRTYREAQRLRRFIEYFNQHQARPMRWTYYRPSPTEKTADRTPPYM